MFDMYLNESKGRLPHTEIDIAGQQPYCSMAVGQSQDTFVDLPRRSSYMVLQLQVLTNPSYILGFRAMRTGSAAETQQSLCVLWELSPASAAAPLWHRFGLPLQPSSPEDLRFGWGPTWAEWTQDEYDQFAQFLGEESNTFSQTAERSHD